MKHYIVKGTTFVVIVEQILLIHVYCTSQNHTNSFPIQKFIKGVGGPSMFFYPLSKIGKGMEYCRPTVTVSVKNIYSYETPPFF